MNLSHACTKASGVLRSPKPYTVSPSSRRRCARRVKSLSLDTRQKPSKRRVYQVHRVDDQRTVGGVLAAGVGELLHRIDRMLEQRLLPLRLLVGGEDAVD